MTWKDYEDSVHAWLASQLPDATFKRNACIRGLASQRMRQVDTLIEQRFLHGTSNWRCIVDAKDRKRRIDVKAVESFLGMVLDVGADRGILVSRHGFSSTAARRVEGTAVQLLHHKPPESPLQGFFLLPNRGPHAASLQIAPGWLGGADLPDDLIGSALAYLVPIEEAELRLGASAFALVNIVPLWDVRATPSALPSQIDLFEELRSSIYHDIARSLGASRVKQSTMLGLVVQQVDAVMVWPTVTMLRDFGSFALMLQLIVRDETRMPSAAMVEGLAAMLRTAQGFEMFGIEPQSCAHHWARLVPGAGRIFRSGPDVAPSQLPVIAFAGLIQPAG
jgi:hypothetical protein